MVKLARVPAIAMCRLCPGIRRAHQPNPATKIAQYEKRSGGGKSVEIEICDWCEEHQSHPENRVRNWDIRVVRKL